MFRAATSLVARAVKQDAAILSACRGFASYRPPVAREPGEPKKHFIEDFQNIGFENWPKPTEAQKARIAKWRAERPSFEEQDAYWADEAANLIDVCKKAGNSETEIATSLSIINFFRSSLKAEQEKKVKNENHVVVMPDWAAMRDQHFFPDYVDELQSEVETVLAELRQQEFYNPDFPYLLEWMDEQDAEMEAYEAEFSHFKDEMKRLQDHTKAFAKRVDAGDVSTDEMIEHLEFKEFSPSVAEGKKMITDTLADIKAKYGNITPDEQEYADWVLAGLERKGEKSIKDQIEDRVRAGDWFR